MFAVRFLCPPLIFFPSALQASFVLEPPDTTAIIGQDAVLDCISPHSIPPAVITWSRDFAQLSDSRFQVLQNGSLLISAVELSDQSTYYCTASNTLLGSSRTSRRAVLTTIGKLCVKYFCIINT